MNADDVFLLKLLLVGGPRNTFEAARLSNDVLPRLSDYERLYYRDLCKRVQPTTSKVWDFYCRTRGFLHARRRRLAQSSEA